MKLAEPVTSITDFLLALEAFVFAALLLAASQDQISVLLWGGAFITVGVAALCGGLFHGLRERLPEKAQLTLWRATAGALLLSPGLFAASGFVAAFSGNVRVILLFCDALFMGIVIFRIARRTEQNYEARSSGPWIFVVLAFLAALLARHLLRSGAQAGTCILVGSIVCLVGVAVQQGGRGFHRNFNHNDLCHVIFMIGLYFLYSGGLSLHDR